MGRRNPRRPRRPEPPKGKGKAPQGGATSVEATVSRETLQREEKGKAGKEAKDNESRGGKAKVTSNGKERDRQRERPMLEMWRRALAEGLPAKSDQLGWVRVSNEILGRTRHDIRNQLDDNRARKREESAAQGRADERSFPWQSGDADDEDDVEDPNTAGAATTRDVTCVRGTGSFAGARTVSGSSEPGVNANAHRKSLSVVNHITKDYKRDGVRDAISRNATSNACNTGKLAKRVMPPAMGVAIPPAAMPQLVSVRKGK